MKVLDSSSLQDSMEARAKRYKNLREQFNQLKKAFNEIVDFDDFEGKGAKSIKDFYLGQIEVVEAWQRLIERQIAFFEGVAGKLQDKDLGGNTRVETDFLKYDLAQKERIADEMITEQKKDLDNIFREIEDLISLDSFSRSSFDEKMEEIHKKRTKTLEAVDELDQELKEEYISSEGEEGYVIQLFSALLEATKQGNSITPINFNAEAFHASEAYQVKSKAEEVTANYLTFKKDENEAREIENRPWYEDFWEGTKTFAGEFSGYYDYKRATEGVDPVTGEKLSTTQRVTAGAMALAGFIPVVGWAGRAVKGGKGIYSATKGISAADHAMSAYKNVRSFSTLEKTEMGIYGLISANGLSEYLTGKDMLGNELTDEQRKASLAQGIFAGLPFVPSVAREANRLGQQAVHSSVQVGKQGKDVTQAWLDNLSNQLNNFGPQLKMADGNGNMLRESRSLNSNSMNSEKEELLSMLSGRSNQVSKAKVETVLKDTDLDGIRKDWKVPETHTIAVGKTVDIPGLEDKVFKGGSIKVRREAGLKDLDDIYPDRDIQAPYSQSNPRHIQFLKHAEEGVIAEFDAAIKELGMDPSDVKGTIYMHQSNPTGVCSICTQGITNPKKAAGIFKQFTDKYPNLRIVVTTQLKEGVRVSGKQEFELKNGKFVE
ncbi:ribonuclease YeeF family protein [Bacillales bacterium AN1005]